MTTLPSVPLGRVLERVASIWSPDQAPHHLIYAASGTGKTTLIKSLLGLCGTERVLIVDPKPNAADPAWDGTADDPWQWGRTVERIGPMFGYQGDQGGGPLRMWYRITGSPDRSDTARRFAAALAIATAEGHTVLVLDDVKETCKQLKLAGQVESVMNLGRSSSLCAILSTTETSFVAGRSQGGMIWVGATNGLDAAKEGAKLLGWSGREAQGTVAAIEPHAWIFSDTQRGTAGPAHVRG